YGALIVDPCAPEAHAYERDHAIVLSDWSDTDPHRILANLKKQGSYYNHHQRTVGDFFRDVKRQGWAATWADRRAWGTMRMTPTDLADVSAATYTYLVNGHTPAMNWTGLFRRGERVRLRFINAAAMTYFDVRIPGHRFTVIAADGQPVQPVEVEEFRLGVAETLDVIVTPQADACTIFAQSMDRTGYARATLATVQGLVAAVPALDPRPLLTMDDMGHGGHAGHGTAATAGSGSDAHAGHGVPAAAQAPAPLPQDPAHHGHHDHHAMMAAAQAAHPGHDGHGAVAAAALRHPASETRNPFVDMQTMAPAPRLADPGIGLRPGDRPEQRRVLSYADLKSAFADPDGREPSRSIELHLTGHMERYVWSFDGIPFGEAPRAGAGGRIASLSPHSALAYQGDMSRGFAAGRLALHPASTGPQRFTSAEPLRLTYGERLRIVLVNDTMMTHPIHLHGMWSDLEDEEGRFLVRKHTISMPPGTRRSFRVTADALGRWAFHCHLLMHMDTGMFREVRVEVAS
ncbi:MAG: multicopper oxidase domain-containing protein, partial [Moraxellaceae bacterium]